MGRVLSHFLINQIVTCLTMHVASTPDVKIDLLSWFVVVGGCYLCGPAVTTKTGETDMGYSAHFRSYTVHGCGVVKGSSLIGMSLWMNLTTARQHKFRRKSN